jgi:mannonate dehydratase
VALRRDFLKHAAILAGAPLIARSQSKSKRLDELTFCVGTWSEGGDKMGKSVFEMIQDFGRRGKLIEVHFRNVTSPLPHFVETFPDDGYMDMYQVMKALREVRFTGAAEPDHVPELIGESGMRRAGTAYIIAYMRSLLRRANEEVG